MSEAAAEEVTEEVVETNEFEERARRQGWKPEDEWEGDPPHGGFKSAEQFLKDGEDINAVLKERNSKLLEDIDHLKSTMKRLVDDFSEQKTRAIEKERKAAEKEKARILSELKSQRKEAISEGDSDRANAIDDKIDEVRSEVIDPGPNPVFIKWKSENTWYGDDPQMSADADILGDQYAATGRFKTPEELYKAVGNKIRQMYPDKFKNPAREEPAVTESAKPVSKSKKKGYSELPPDAKAACDDFVKNIPGYTRDKYLSTYEWDEE